MRGVEPNALRRASSPINVAVDAAGLFIAALSWVCLVWVPIILLLVPFILRKTSVPTLAYIVILIPIAVGSVLVGLLLQWLAGGVVRRRPARILFSVALLVLWAVVLVVPPRRSPPRPGLKVFQSWVQAVALFCAAGFTAVGLTNRARIADE